MLSVPDDLAPRAVLPAVHRGPEGDVAAEPRVGGEEAGAAVPGLVRPAPEVGLPALTNHSSPAVPLSTNHSPPGRRTVARGPGGRGPRCSAAAGTCPRQARPGPAAAAAALARDKWDGHRE